MFKYVENKMKTQSIHQFFLEIIPVNYYLRVMHQDENSTFRNMELCNGGYGFSFIITNKIKYDIVTKYQMTVFENTTHH